MGGSGGSSEARGVALVQVWESSLSLARLSPQEPRLLEEPAPHCAGMRLLLLRFAH